MQLRERLLFTFTQITDMSLSTMWAVAWFEQRRNWVSPLLEEVFYTLMQRYKSIFYPNHTDKQYNKTVYFVLQIHYLNVHCCYGALQFQPMRNLLSVPKKKGAILQSGNLFAEKSRSKGYSPRQGIFSFGFIYPFTGQFRIVSQMQGFFKIGFRGEFIELIEAHTSTQDVEIGIVAHPVFDRV